MASSEALAAPVIHVVDATDDTVVLDLEGEFDISAAPDVARHAQEILEAGKHLVVNISDVTFIDSSMIHALFTADAAAQKAGRGFVLQFGTHAAVERVLEITGTDKALQTAPTRAAAIDLVEGRV